MLVNYHAIIAKLIRSNNINILDAIEYSNIISNKNNIWNASVIEQVKTKVASLYNATR